MKFIIPIRLQDLLTPEQHVLLNQAGFDVVWMVEFTLRIWQVLFGESQSYAVEVMESELEHVARLVTTKTNELEPWQLIVRDNTIGFTQMSYSIYQQLAPYLGTLPITPSCFVLEKVEAQTFAGTAMVIEMAVEGEDGELVEDKDWFAGAAP